MNYPLSAVGIDEIPAISISALMNYPLSAVDRALMKYLLSAVDKGIDELPAISSI